MLKKKVNNVVGNLQLKFTVEILINIDDQKLVEKQDKVQFHKSNSFPFIYMKMI